MNKLVEPTMLRWLSVGVAPPSHQFHQGTPTFRRVRPRSLWLRQLNLDALEAQVAAEARTTRLLSSWLAAA